MKSDMLKNLILDMGNVLLKYDPAYFIERCNIHDNHDKELLMKQIFLSEEWKKLDLGEMIEEELYEQCKDILPEHLHQIAYDLILRWHDPIEEIPGMKDLLSFCKEKGLKIYLLSNASKSHRQYWERYEGKQYFDGIVVSAYENCVKPSKEIYQILLDRYQLDKKECLFVDDVKENVDGAMKMHIPAYLFDGNAENLKDVIIERLEEE